jgi:hypothetical protein
LHSGPYRYKVVVQDPVQNSHNSWFALGKHAPRLWTQTHVARFGKLGNWGAQKLQHPACLLFTITGLLSSNCVQHQ